MWWDSVQDWCMNSPNDDKSETPEEERGVRASDSSSSIRRQLVSPRRFYEKGIELAKKLEGGGPWSPDDIASLEELVGARLDRLRRQQAIMNRAEEVKADMSRQMGALPPPKGTGKTTEDWVLRFLRYAEDISDDAMQDVYARILAGELVRPGSFSMRTLVVLRNLDRSLAQAFAEMMSFVIEIEGMQFVPTKEKRPGSDWWFQNETVLRLADAGLMHLRMENFVHYVERSRELRIRYGTHMIRLRHPRSDEGDAFPTQLQGYPLTIAGAELSRIPAFQPDEKFLASVCESFWYYDDDLVIERAMGPDAGGGQGEAVWQVMRRAR